MRERYDCGWMAFRCSARILSKRARLRMESPHYRTPRHPKPTLPIRIAQMSSTVNNPRELWGIIPNYRAVSANTHLPPLTIEKKFWLATQDTFDYSNFLLVGGLAGISLAKNRSRLLGKAVQDTAGTIGTSLRTAESRTT